MSKIIFIVILFFVQTVSAQELQLLQYEELNRREKKDYEFVIQSCNYSVESLSRLVDSTKEDTFGYFGEMFAEPSNIPRETTVARKGLGKNTHRLLHSKGYYVGLMTCFPENENKRHMYTLSLLMLDTYGKSTTVSVLALGAWGFQKGLAYLGRKLAIAPTVYIFKKLKASEKLLTKIPVYMGRTGRYSFAGLSIGLIGHLIYETKKEKELHQKIFGPADTAEIQKDLERNLALYIRTQELKALAQTPSETAAAEKLLTEQKEIVVFYLDKLIENEQEPSKREYWVDQKQAVEENS